MCTEFFWNSLLWVLYSPVCRSLCGGVIGPERGETRGLQAWLVAPMGESPPVPDRSFCDTHCGKTCWRLISRTAWSYITKLHRHTPHILRSVPVNHGCVSPSHSRDKSPASFQRCHTVVTTVTVGVLWRLVRPTLRDDGRFLRLGYAVLYTHHLPWPGDRQGRPSWPY